MRQSLRYLSFSERRAFHLLLQLWTTKSTYFRYLAECQVCYLNGFILFWFETLSHRKNEYEMSFNIFLLLLWCCWCVCVCVMISHYWILKLFSVLIELHLHNAVLYVFACVSRYWILSLPKISFSSVVIAYSLSLHTHAQSFLIDAATFNYYYALSSSVNYSQMNRKKTEYNASKAKKEMYGEIEKEKNAMEKHQAKHVAKMDFNMTTEGVYVHHQFVQSAIEIDTDTYKILFLMRYRFLLSCFLLYHNLIKGTCK